MNTEGVFRTSRASLQIDETKTNKQERKQERPRTGPKRTKALGMPEDNPVPTLNQSQSTSTSDKWKSESTRCPGDESSTATGEQTGQRRNQERESISSINRYPSAPVQFSSQRRRKKTRTRFQFHPMIDTGACARYPPSGWLIATQPYAHDMILPPIWCLSIRHNTNTITSHHIRAASFTLASDASGSSSVCLPDGTLDDAPC